MAGLLYVQIQIYKEDVAVYREQFNLLVPSYLSEMRDEIRGDREWVDAVNAYVGQDSFRVESFERRLSRYIIRLMLPWLD